MYENGTADISGLDPVDVIRALYARAQSPGMGSLHRISGDLPREEAEKLVGVRLDYLHGRVMKVKVGDGEVRGANLYERDNGDGVIEAVINALRKQTT
jgi:hypothetical protein